MSAFELDTSASSALAPQREKSSLGDWKPVILDQTTGETTPPEDKPNLTTMRPVVPFKDLDGSEFFFEPDEVSFWGYVQSQYRMGVSNTLAGMYGSAVIKGQMDPETGFNEAKRALSMQENSLSVRQAHLHEDPVRAVVGMFAGVVPQLMEAADAGSKSFALASPFIIGAALSPIPVIDEATAIAAAAFAFQGRAYQRIAELYQGMDYIEMRQADISDEVARPIATVSGGIAGLLNVMGVRVMSGSVARGFAKHVLASPKNLWSIGKNFLVRAGKDVSNIAAENLSQAAASLFGKAVASWIEEKPNAMPTSKDIWERVGQELEQSVGMGAVGIAGESMSAIRQAVELKTGKKLAAPTPEANTSGPVLSEAEQRMPEVMKAREELAALTDEAIRTLESPLADTEGGKTRTDAAAKKVVEKRREIGQLVRDARERGKIASARVDEVTALGEWADLREKYGPGPYTEEQTLQLQDAEKRITQARESYGKLEEARSKRGKRPAQEVEAPATPKEQADFIAKAKRETLKTEKASIDKELTGLVGTRERVAQDVARGKGQYVRDAEAAGKRVDRLIKDKETFAGNIERQRKRLDEEQRRIDELKQDVTPNEITEEIQRVESKTDNEIRALKALGESMGPEQSRKDGIPLAQTLKRGYAEERIAQLKKWHGDVMARRKAAWPQGRVDKARKVLRDTERIRNTQFDKNIASARDTMKNLYEKTARFDDMKKAFAVIDKRVIALSKRGVEVERKIRRLAEQGGEAEPGVKASATVQQLQSEIKSAIRERDKMRSEQVKSVSQQLGMTNNAVRKLMGKVDILRMTDTQFGGFMDRLSTTARTTRDKQLIQRGISLLGRQRRILHYDRVANILGIASMSKATPDELLPVYRKMQEIRLDDKVLTTQRSAELRKLGETFVTENDVDQWAARRYKEKTGVDASIDEIVAEIKASSYTQWDFFRNELSLEKRNPFYKVMGDVLGPALKRASERVKEIDSTRRALMYAAYKSRVKVEGLAYRFGNMLAPQNKRIFDWLSEEDPARLAELVADMTSEELTAAEYMERTYQEMRQYFEEQNAAQKFVEAYIPHIRKGFLENVREGKYGAAVKTLFRGFEDEVAKMMPPPVDAKGRSLSSQGYFRFLMRRTGKVDPSLNVGEVFMRYVRAFVKKQETDNVRPLLGALTQGLEDPNLADFYTKFLEMKIDGKPLMLVAERAPAIASFIRMFGAVMSIWDLGMNIKAGLTSWVGEGMSVYLGQGAGGIAVGSKRWATKAGRDLIRKYERVLLDQNLIRGENALWKDPDVSVPSKLYDSSFVLFSLGKRVFDNIELLNMVTPEELRVGEISPERLNEIHQHMARWRVVGDYKSLVGSSLEAKEVFRYRKWVVPIIRTEVNNFAELVKRLSGDKVKMDPQAVSELYRTFHVIGAGVTALMFMRQNDEDDEPTFMSKLAYRAISEWLSIFGAVRVLSGWTASPAAMLNKLGRLTELLSTGLHAVALEVFGDEDDAEEKWERTGDKFRKFLPGFIRQVGELLTEEE